LPGIRNGDKATRGGLPKRDERRKKEADENIYWGKGRTVNSHKKKVTRERGVFR